jgi:hypothetical protein
MAIGSLPPGFPAVEYGARAVSFPATWQRSRSSRTRANTGKFKEVQVLRSALARLLGQAPPHLLDSEDGKLLSTAADHKVYSLVQLIYRSQHYEGQSKDYEFSRQACRIPRHRPHAAPSRTPRTSPQPGGRLHFRSRLRRLRMMPTFHRTIESHDERA